MKTKSLTIPSGNVYDPALEEMLQKRDVELKVLAEKNSKNFAQRNLPTLVGDHLLNYTGEIKAGYEKLGTEVFHYLQPEAHFPEAKVDADYFREKVKKLDTEINEKEAQNQRDENSLRDFAQNSIPTRVLWAVLITFLITIGEIVFNTKAFQVTGENMLFALVLSICISIAVFVFAHMTPMLYKGAKTKMQRISVVVGALLLVTGLFTALAIFRSSYLATHDVYIQPGYFVIINLFFFIVSALLSFFVLPSWSEIKENALLLKLQYVVKKRKKEIEQLKAEREKIGATIMERTKVRIRIAHYANYAIERIRKMYLETMGMFKTINLTYRNDNTPPDCFSEDPPTLDLDNFYYSLITDKTN
jgi:cation transport ATPase